MKYNFIETNDVVKSIYEINGINEEELNKEYDFIIKDEVFLNFKDKLLENKDKKFLIVGDYDCDGICATTIIKKLLNHLNIQNNFIIPSRINQGYGLNEEMVKMAKEHNFDCLILVDNGIVCNKEIDLANSLGIKVFIIDHHEYEFLPNAECVIHSNIVNNTYSELSAGGLSFVLSRCFYDDELSLALGGLSTISDMMKVTGFNRYLIKEMMSLLIKGDIYQLKLLNDSNTFTYESLSFNVIPKINALSRMEPIGDANKLVQYFLADEKTCRITIEQIDYVNEKRKANTKTMTAEAYRLINNTDDVLIVSSCNFMEGLCGLVANKLVHSYNKPVIVLSLKDGVYKGSGRSIDGFNLYEVLKPFENYDSFGGHEGAIGLSIKEENFQEFLNYVRDINIDIKENYKDVFLINEESINFKLLSQLESLKPFGLGLKEPLLAIKNNAYKKMIVSCKYPKFIIRNDLSAISFNEFYKDFNPEYLIGHIKEDGYHKDSIQLLIEDLV